MSEGNEKTIYFVRHGESEANSRPVFQSIDSPLSETGKAQATLIAERAVNLSFDALISSPYPRAKDTAETIAKLTGKTPEYSDLFIERIKSSSVSNQPHTDKVANKLWTKWEESLFTSGMKVEDGENFDDLILRADRTLAYLTERPEQSILVVTHGFIMRVIIARVVLGELLTPDVFRSFIKNTKTENTGLSAIKFDANRDGSSKEMRSAWRLWIFNDHAHLG